MKVIAKTAAALGLMAAMVSAQSMEETVSKLGEAAAKAYVAPIVSGFGSNLNAGWYHKAPPAKKFGFNIEAGVVTMATLLKGGDKDFSASGAFRLDSAAARSVANDVDTAGTFGQGQRLRDSVAAAIRRTDINVTFVGPTIIGADDQAMTYEVAPQPITVGTLAGDTVITLPTTVNTITTSTGDTLYAGILDGLAALPLFAPQLTIGTIYGTNLTLRWLPEIQTNDDIGKVKFFGFGVQHNPGVWFNNPLPVDVGIGYFMQTLEVGTLFKATSQAYGLSVSKTLGWRFLNLTPYGGFQYESSSFDFAYDLVLNEGKPNETTRPISFTLEGENKYRATAGLSVRVLAININGDYNFGKYNSFSAGVMVGI